MNELLSRQPFKAVAKRLLDEDVHAEEFSHTVIHSKKKRSPKTTDGSAFSSASASPTRRADRTEPPRRADLPSRTAAASPKTSPKASPQKPSPARAPLTAAKRARYPSVAYPPAAPLPRGRGGDRVGSPENRPNNVTTSPSDQRPPPAPAPEPAERVRARRRLGGGSVARRSPRAARARDPASPREPRRDVLEAKALRAGDVAERERRRDALRAEADARRQKARDDARREFKARQAQARANRRACRPDGDGDGDANVAKKNPSSRLRFSPRRRPSRLPDSIGAFAGRSRASPRVRSPRFTRSVRASRGPGAAPSRRTGRLGARRTPRRARGGGAEPRAGRGGGARRRSRGAPDHAGSPRSTQDPQDHPGAPRTPEHRAFGTGSNGLRTNRRGSRTPVRPAEAYEAREVAAARDGRRGENRNLRRGAAGGVREREGAGGANRARATEDAKGLIGDERSGLIGEVALAEGGAKLLIEALGSGEYGALGASTAPPDGFVAAQIAPRAPTRSKAKKRSIGGTRGSNPRSETTYSGATSEGTSSDERGSSEVDDVLAYSKFRLHDGATLCLPSSLPTRRSGRARRVCALPRARARAREV